MRPRIAPQPDKVYSTDCKATGIVAKYKYEQEQKKFRTQRVNAKTKSWDKLRELIALEEKGVELEKQGII